MLTVSINVCITNERVCMYVIIALGECRVYNCGTCETVSDGCISE